jgi:hypothetical protein
MYFPCQALELVCRRQSARARKLIPVFHLLEKSGYAHFHEFIEITGRDGEKLDSFEQGITFILGLLPYVMVPRGIVNRWLQPRNAPSVTGEVMIVSP